MECRAHGRLPTISGEKEHHGSIVAVLEESFNIGFVTRSPRWQIASPVPQPLWSGRGTIATLP
jgi:hypothetical protein